MSLYVVGNFSKAVHTLQLVCTRSMMMSPHFFNEMQWLRAVCFYWEYTYYAILRLDN